MNFRTILFFFAAVPLLLGGLLFLYWNNPTESRWLPQCTFHQLTGWYCPGCGSTRALYALLHGHLWEAWRANPWMWLALTTAALLGVKPVWCLKPWVGYTILSVTLLFWICRNLPWEPFSRLAPL